ncbi:MAG: hypothetical protein ACYTEZ_19500 [Planctomycetota bacterium]|jgi:hypothetical protein
MFVVQPTIRVGDRPGRGTWRCLDCNWRAKLEGDWEPLPACGGDCKKDATVDETQVRYARVRGLV